MNSKCLQRFERSYIPEPMSGCFLWLGSAHRTHGYWSARFFNGEKYEIASRFVWRLKRGPIPLGRWVLHTCDNSLCVNEDHLYLGDHQQNMADRETRGRGRHQRDPDGTVAHMREIRKLARHDGEHHSQAKLTWEKVREIRASPLHYKELAPLYGVDPVHIWNIKAGKYWKEKL
jgi:hypothetical protein